MALSLLLSSSAWSQDRRPIRVPGAIRLPTPFAGAPAPFDVAAHFRVVPPADNAAVACLDALLEFSEEVAACFPEPDFTSRAAIARGRMRQLMAIHDQWARDPVSVDLTRARRALMPFGLGWSKLEAARKKPTCFFERDLGGASFRGHALALRQLERVLEVQAFVDVRENRAADSLGPLESYFRLSAGMRPRGQRSIMSELLAADRDCCKRVVPMLANALRLDAANASKLAQLIDAHDLAIRGSALEAMREDYWALRSAIAGLAERKPSGLSGRAIHRTLTQAAALDLADPLGGNETRDGGDPAPAGKSPTTRGNLRNELLQIAIVEEILDDAVAEMTREDIGREYDALDEWRRASEAMLQSPLDASKAKPLETWPRAKWLRCFKPPSVEALWRMEGENLVWVRCTAIYVANCQAAAAKGERFAAKALDSASNAKLDPFDGKAMKWTRTNDQIRIYSVGHRRAQTNDEMSDELSLKFAIDPSQP